MVESSLAELSEMTLSDRPTIVTRGGMFGVGQWIFKIELGKKFVIHGFEECLLFYGK